MKKIICPCCHKEVKLRRTNKQRFLLIVLLCLGIVPGIIYWIFSKKRMCPKCKCRLSRKAIKQAKKAS